MPAILTRAVGLAAASLLAAPAPSIAADPESIVEALKIVAGNPPMMRATFARGQCVRGTYTPAPDAARLTRSISLTRSWPIVGRFSVGGGNPNVADTTKTVLRGFSVKILSDNGGTDLLFENAPVHFAKTLDQMLGFLRVRAPGPDGKPNQGAIAAFTAANPETTRQAAFVAAKPLPGSFAGIVYWGVHTFAAINAASAETPIKFKVVPHAGEIGLTDEEAKAKPARFLVDDLRERLAQAPVRFDIVALIGTPNDQAADVTQRWTDEDGRTGVTLGTVAVAALDSNATCDADIFDPGNLADGIGRPQDEIYQARLKAYRISQRLRSAE